jgi:uncharacterized NAD(P)/FAD-binding protein YdhS
MVGPMRSAGRTIAIIGGGFSGCTLAINLLRQQVTEPTRIVLIERRAEVGRGAAYQTDSYPHLLNVPAARMSADSRDPQQFARFARQRYPDCEPPQFLPRQLYGEYLQSMLEQAQHEADGRVNLQRIHAQADTLYPIEARGPYLVSLSNQQHLFADDVVLACGDPPPADLACAAAVADHCAYVRDPLGSSALRTPARSVLLIGSGLTMADVAIASAALNPEVRIHAISRHGLLPAAQIDAAPVVPAVADLKSRLPAGAVRARSLLPAFRSLLAEVESHAGDWRDAINLARQTVPQLWSAMAHVERARFLRHLRAYWDVHRHRMSPAVASEISRLRSGGQLQVHAGRIQALAGQGDRIAVQWRRRGGEQLQRLEVDRVVNCAGTDQRLSQTRDPLLKALMADGLAVPDPLGLGWQTDKRGALMDRHGNASSHLFYVGPMLRARHWEATAVGELRGHVESLAQSLTAQAPRISPKNPKQIPPQIAAA